MEISTKEQIQHNLNNAAEYLSEGAIKLVPFDEAAHLDALIKKASDPRIWACRRNNMQEPEIFKRDFIEKAKKHIQQQTRYMFVIYFNDEVIGSTSYYNVDLEHLKTYIGYTWLHPDYWGKGINPIIKHLMLSYAFEQLHFKRVEFCVDADNLRSRAALEKLNIPLEGILKNHQIRPDGSNRDSAIYALTDELWTTLWK